MRYTCRGRLRRAAEAPVTGLISVILTTYQREDALDAVLRALSRQTDRPFEVIVADDGSGPPTLALLERRAAQADIPIKHVWQEDRGFQSSRNRRFANAPGKGANWPLAARA